MKYQSKANKAKMQKIIAAVCVLLVIVVWLVVFLATRNPKKEEVPVETTLTTETTTAPVTTEETTTTEITYDYTMKIDMEEVKKYHEQNEDVVGWVYIDDTQIDYPIVQGEDNEEYLHADWMGEYSYSGCIFQDYRSNMQDSENNLIYGHNMAAGTMFHGIKLYKDKDWGKDHLFVEVASLELDDEKKITGTKRYLYEIFSVNVLDGLEGANFEYWNCIDMDEEDYEGFYKAIEDTTRTWYGDVGVNNIPKFDDKLLTMQTCDTGDDDGVRCVAFAKRLGEF